MMAHRSRSWLATIGTLATSVYALTQGWLGSIPMQALGAGVGGAVAIGAFSGVYPAIRSARVAPTGARRTVGSGMAVCRAAGLGCPGGDGTGRPPPAALDA